MTPKHSANSLAAKARKRMAAPPPDYPIAPDYARPVRQLVITDLIANQSHTFTLFISPHRIDQYRVEVDGKPWKDRIGWSRILAAVRRSQARFSQVC